MTTLFVVYNTKGKYYNTLTKKFQKNITEECYMSGWHAENIINTYQAKNKYVNKGKKKKKKEFNFKYLYRIIDYNKGFFINIKDDVVYYGSFYASQRFPSRNKALQFAKYIKEKYKQENIKVVTVISNKVVDYIKTQFSQEELL